MIFRRVLCAGLLAAGAACASAESVGDSLQRLLGRAPATDEILDPESAFRLHAGTAGPTSASLLWTIEDGYYLYRDKFSFTVSDGAARVDAAQLAVPRGEWKEDEIFGSVEVNTGAVEIVVPLTRSPGPELPVTLTVGYQGCKDKAVCYPPIKKQLSLTLPSWSGISAESAAAPALSESDAISRRLGDAGFVGNLLVFFGFGLLLSLTPCVFPLVPILSGIVIGHGRVSLREGLLLSLAYVLAMAAAYAGLGVVAGSFGVNLQSAAQSPWVIGLFSVVFIALALSMFDLFHMRLPAGFQTWLSALSDRHGGGTWRGAAVMGALSAVIAGPCVAPPLAGALLYISQTGDAVLGGAALFAMGLGLGVPLLLLGASAGSLLPRAGHWMTEIKRIFGAIMLGVAIWLLGRVLPGPATLVLWALLFIVAGVYLGALERSGAGSGAARVMKGIGVALLVYGAALLVGAAGGADDPLRPLAGFTAGGTQTEALPFRRVKNLAALRDALEQAGRERRTVMLDFYADWCVECKRMERNTFPDPRVRDRLRDVVLLQADVTANDPASLEMLAAYELFGPPAILFFGPGGEVRTHRLIGYLSAEEFLAHLEEALRS